MKRIDSPGNVLVKKIRRLARASRSRRREILLEGFKLVAAAVESGIEIETIVVSSRVFARVGSEIPDTGAEIVEADDALFRELSSVDSPEGVLALALRPRRPIEELPGRGAVLVSDGVRDPGNLGAIARVAEAAGIEALVVVKGSVDPFGPKALRGSMGSLLRLPLFEIDDLSILAELPFRFAALAPRGGTDFRTFDWRPPIAILLGSESQGLSKGTAAVSPAPVSIPMRGGVESLNVATAAALIAYEVTRPGK